MLLYLVQFDAQDYYVEAPDFPAAIELWKVHVAKLWGDDYDGTEQPESVALVHDEPVVRVANNEATDAAIEWAGRYAGIEGAHLCAAEIAIFRQAADAHSNVVRVLAKDREDLKVELEKAYELLEARSSGNLRPKED